MARGQCHDLKAGAFSVWMKARGSWLLAKLFNQRFLNMMADATKKYAAELRATPVPETERAFWGYVIAQEEVQVRAFEQAKQGNFDTAARMLADFAAETSIALDTDSQCTRMMDS